MYMKGIHYFKTLAIFWFKLDRARIITMTAISWHSKFNSIQWLMEDLFGRRMDSQVTMAVDWYNVELCTNKQLVKEQNVSTILQVLIYTGVVTRFVEGGGTAQ